MITKEQRKDIQRRLANLYRWIARMRHRNRSDWASWKAGSEPSYCVVTNEERSLAEVFDWVHDPPSEYFLYIDVEKGKATTWMGDSLGDVTLGKPYRVPAFGQSSERCAVWVTGTNGCKYYGTYYRSSGDYARVKRCKQ